MFTVTYVDDFNKKHITVARNMAELKSLKDRFDIVEYTPIKK